ncbi:MAG TPA: hybrid sensor histidine kinase/response regulator [Actinomycetota bacterium]|nr:hybrid sensor histidine kinase/response regulator [Actinomycetota bacterium]
MSSVVVCRAPGTLADADRAFAGETLEPVDDGYRAVEVAQRTRADLVVVDLGVAALSPGELIKRLRSSNEEVRVIFVLARPAVEEAADVLRAGADGVLAPRPSADALRWAADEARAGGCPISPSLARGLAERFADIVHREQQWSKTLADVSRQAEELAHTKAEFLSNVSHELRTPLTIIKGVAQVVGRFGNADEQQAGMLAQLEEAATKLTRMVENLLVIAEMERGDFRLDLADHDLAELVRTSAEAAAVRYPAVTLDLRIPPFLRATLDAERMGEVIRHLVDNACRYSDEGDTVTVQARKASEGIVITVTDQGHGVDRKVVSAAFGEAFSPGESVLTKEKAGLGLGLNLARSVVAQHGGILSADPLPGGGSRISVILPPEVKPQAAPAAATNGDHDQQDEAPEDPMALLRELQRKLSDSESRVQ